MKKLITFTATALLATSALVFASGDHQYHNSTSSTGEQPIMMDMSGDIQSKITKMKADMKSIQNVSDRKKRQRLMKEHMKKMHGVMKVKTQQSSLEIRVILLEAMVEQIMVNQINSLDPNDPVYTIDTMDDF